MGAVQSTMTARLKKTYIALLVPVVLGFTIAGLIRACLSPTAPPERLTAALGPVIFIMTALVSIAGPILYRSIFAHRRRHLSEILPNDLLKFERKLVAMGMAAPYLALVAFWMQLSRFHFAGTLLLALYAVYTAYPSRRRISFDRRIFRTRDTTSAARSKM